CFSHTHSGQADAGAAAVLRSWATVPALRTLSSHALPGPHRAPAQCLLAGAQAGQAQGSGRELFHDHPSRSTSRIRINKDDLLPLKGRSHEVCACRSDLTPGGKVRRTGPLAETDKAGSIWKPALSGAGGSRPCGYGGSWNGPLVGSDPTPARRSECALCADR